MSNPFQATCAQICNPGYFAKGPRRTKCRYNKQNGNSKKFNAYHMGNLPHLLWTPTLSERILALIFISSFDNDIKMIILVLENMRKFIFSEFNINKAPKDQKLFSGPFKIYFYLFNNFELKKAVRLKTQFYQLGVFNRKK